MSHELKKQAIPSSLPSKTVRKIRKSNVWAARAKNQWRRRCPNLASRPFVHFASRHPGFQCCRCVLPEALRARGAPFTLKLFLALTRNGSERVQPLHLPFFLTSASSSGRRRPGNACGLSAFRKRAGLPAIAPGATAGATCALTHRTPTTHRIAADTISRLN